jgi:hypothetical protein
MTNDPIENLQFYEDRLISELRGHATALEVGSLNAAERSLTDAAKYASIVVALRSMVPPQ